MNEKTTMGKSPEWKPWYRQKGYKGKLTEDEKRFLDSFRNGNPHPATSFEDLPDEVQSRLIELEDQLKDQEDIFSVWLMLLTLLLSGYAFYIGFTDEIGLSAVGCYCFGLFGFFTIYRTYNAYVARHEHHNWYGDTNKGEPFSSTDEALQRCWEWKAMSAYKHRKVDSE